MREPIPPQPDEYAPYYAPYISKVGAGPLLEQLEANGQATRALLSSLDPEKVNHAYAPGKWTLGQLVGHLSDTERVFAYRLLHAARGGGGALPGMDQEVWAQTRDVSGLTLADLAAEFAAVRAATLFLLRGLNGADWSRVVHASGADMTVRALAHVIAGHELHHIGLLRERYLA